MSGELIVDSIRENIGEVATGVLMKSIPDLEKLQLQLLHINHLSEQLVLQLPHHQLSQHLGKTREIVGEFEDAIDDYASRSGFGSKANSSVLVSPYYKLSELIARRSLRLKIKSFTARMNSIAEFLEACVAKKFVCHDRITNLFVGRDEDIRVLNFPLLENMDVSIVSIVGVAGIGKTTLAKLLFDKLDDHFQRFAWINLSINKSDFKSVLHDLMSQLDWERPNLRTMHEIDLLSEIHKLQMQRKCLIVLDGVWSETAWSNLVNVFPSRQQGSISKLLVTTQIRGVGEMVAANSGILHVLKPFSVDESWKLISTRALRPGLNINASKKMVKKIARKCNHIPLAMNLLGEYLARKRTLSNWNRNRERERDGIHQLLSLIYMDLPMNLKHCIFYLAAFFENLEIDTDKLYPLWIAEGLVQSGYGGSTETMIQIADRYLAALAYRGLVEVVAEDYSRSRKFRACRLNSVIRDISLLIAKEENYLDVMDHRLSTSGSCEHFSVGKARKVAAYLGEDRCECSISLGQEKNNKIHSLLLLGTSMIQSQHKIFLEESLSMFKVLKVLHLDNLNFEVGKYPKQIEKLVFLRYLSFRNCYLKELPSSISKLSNLQTLDLRVRVGCVITIHNALRTLGRMKHLYLPQLFWLHNYEKLRLDTLRDLETLENFDSKLCFAGDLIHLINLRFLTASVYDNLEDLEATVKSSKYLCEVSLQIKHFHCFPRLEIEKLFQCNGLNRLYLGGYLGRLPTMSCSSLTVMVFNCSKFNDDPMAMLGKLPSLRVLAFDNYAFVGKQLCSTPGFYELRYLRLSTLPNLENLILEKGTMPKLYGLTILGCKSLTFHLHQLKFLKHLRQTNIKGTAEAFQELQALQDGSQFEEFSKYSKLKQDNMVHAGLS